MHCGLTHAPPLHSTVSAQSGVQYVFFLLFFFFWGHLMRYFDRPIGINRTWQLIELISHPFIQIFDMLVAFKKNP